MLTNEELGERIRAHRLRMGLTQEALAERSGVSRETIGRLEQASVHKPTLDTVFRLAKALGTTGSALIAELPSDELAGLVQSLPDREQAMACAMLRALAAHVNGSDQL